MSTLIINDAIMKKHGMSKNRSPDLAESIIYGIYNNHTIESNTLPIYIFSSPVFVYTYSNTVASSNQMRLIRLCIHENKNTIASEKREIEIPKYPYIIFLFVVRFVSEVSVF